MLKWKYISIGVLIYALIVVFVTLPIIFNIGKGINFAYLGSFIGMIFGTLIIGYAVNKNFDNGVMHGIVVGIIGSIFAIIMIILNTQMHATYIITGLDSANMINRCIIVLICSIILGGLFGGIGGTIGSAIKNKNNDILKCPYCGEKNPSNAQFCSECGNSFKH